ncbi:MAG: Mur ligase family protein, partial [Oscillospiraceae bacterium]|nr:Mur ligase family protein [Oscillospiraceae bacterium]
MNYDEAIEYVHSIPWMGKGLGLKRIGALLLAVGNPENELKFIHVAGTNGKGSICEMTARILESAGYKTGFFVSPYIHRFNERMQINHRPISDDELAELVGLLKPVAEKMEDPPSEFEVITAAAFLYFKKNKCDYVVLEVGMGGRLDATNVIATPLAAVIATIGLDHTKHLGNTVGEIAYEKAGIIKPAGDVVVYGQGGEAAQVFRRVSDERGASLRFSDFTLIEALGEDDEFQYFKYKSGGSYSLSLHGEHQLKNAATVLELVALLREKGVALSEKAVADGLAGARWPGRFETL